jgi:predicted nucleic acid-binding Zn ribbon protein
MPFQPISQVLNTLRQRRGWKEYQQFQQVLKIWPEAVGKAVSLQTRPVGVDIRGVLKVATSSSTWSQNLGFERRHILVKLNQRLAHSLTDIHFSSGQWSGRQWPSGQQQSPVRYLGTFVHAPPTPSLQEPRRDPQTAFRAWARVIRQHSQNLPLCPRCQCPTPPEELKPKGVCTLCSVRNFS